MNGTKVKNLSDNVVPGLYTIISPIPMCEDGQLVNVTLQINASEGIAADANHVQIDCTGTYEEKNNNNNDNDSNDSYKEVSSNASILFINKGSSITSINSFLSVEINCSFLLFTDNRNSTTDTGTLGPYSPINSGDSGWLVHHLVHHIIS